MRFQPLNRVLLCASLIMLAPAAAQAQAQPDPELRRLLQQAIETESGFEDRFDAQVWLLDMSQRLEKYVAEPTTRIEMLKRIHYEARRANLEPELVLAVIQVESAFDEYAISVSGARGLMQVMPFWLNEINLSDNNLFRIHTNLRMGCTILRYYMDMEPHDLGRALARYNGSLGSTVYPNRVIEALHRNWFKQ